MVWTSTPPPHRSASDPLGDAMPEDRGVSESGEYSIYIYIYTYIYIYI